MTAKVGALNSAIPRVELTFFQDKVVDKFRDCDMSGWWQRCVKRPELRNLYRVKIRFEFPSTSVSLWVYLELRFSESNFYKWPLTLEGFALDSYLTLTLEYCFP